MRSLRERAAALSRRRPWLGVALTSAYIVPAMTLALWTAFRVGDDEVTVVGGTVAGLVVLAVYVTLRVAVRAWLRESRPINTFTRSVPPAVVAALAVSGLAVLATTGIADAHPPSDRNTASDQDADLPGM